jgi:hypothetical protein
MVSVAYYREESGLIETVQVFFGGGDDGLGLSLAYVIRSSPGTDCRGGILDCGKGLWRKGMNEVSTLTMRAAALPSHISGICLLGLRTSCCRTAR